MIVTGAWVCLLAPLAGFLAIVLAGTRITRRQSGFVSTASVFVGFVGALASLIATLGEDPEERSHTSTAWTWLAAGDFKVNLDILVDPVSLTMMLIITGVGGLIVLYSNGYMAGEDEERRYFAYMAFFVFSMLLLVMGGNLLLLLVGWGLVGLASYLLIGFYHDRPEAIAAAKKAFIVNAIGDAAMALGFFLLIAKTGTLDFTATFDAAADGQLSSSTANLVALGLLAGAVAKSAQLPLHTWLPDAMEGPTPVSALIHAATMVTAGVYLIVRTHAIFEAAPDVQHLAAVLGGVTLVVAGLVALVQWDIKRVIAYSTMSQIGYMFLAAGIGAYGYAMFHLMTHAFFKALLFLAAGVIIHHLAGEQDIRKMGGLRGVMPFTHAVFLVGALALAGIPPFSGFWSKDGIISSALAEGGVLGYSLLVLGLVGALLTGAYTFRLYFLVFRGQPSELVLEHAGGHGAAHGDGARTLQRRHACPRRGAALDAPSRRGARGARDHRRPGRDPRRLGAVPRVDRRRRGAARRADGRPGLRDERGRRHTRRHRHLARPPGVRGLEGARPGRSRPDAARAQVLLRRALRRRVLAPRAAPRGLAAHASRDPIVQGSIDELADGTRDVGGGVAGVQTGLLRTYALVVTASVVILAIVFLVLR